MQCFFFLKHLFDNEVLAVCHKKKKKTFFLVSDKQRMREWGTMWLR